MSAQNVNVVVITGNLTKDPEANRYGDTYVCQLRVAVNSRRKQDEEWVDKANYFDVTVFGGQAENCHEHLKKGRPVAIEGRLDFQEWDAKDGSGKRYRVQIIANTVQFLGSKDGASPSGSGNAAQAATDEVKPEHEFAGVGAGGTKEGIPF